MSLVSIMGCTVTCVLGNRLEIKLYIKGWWMQKESTKSVESSNNIDFKSKMTALVSLVQNQIAHCSLSSMLSLCEYKI